MAILPDSAFVSVKHAFINYQYRPSFLQRLSGRQPTTHSVLRDINFQLQQGDKAVVFGLPGSGKSTLLRLLAGALSPSEGQVIVNGTMPHKQAGIAAGYVSSEEDEPNADTVTEALHTYAHTHQLSSGPARIGAVMEILSMSPIATRPIRTLSTIERLQLNIARAAISDTPLVLLDDVPDALGVGQTEYILKNLFAHRTCLLATRSSKLAEKLELPLLLLHQGSLAHHGSCEDIAKIVDSPRLVDVWVEALRYDTLRTLRSQPGIEEVRLLPTDRFDGQRLRISLLSSRYLPALYDIVSQTELVKIHEIPPALDDVLARLK